MAKKKEKDGFKENLKTLGIAFVIAIGFRSFLFEPFNIPSGSMIPTLLVGDYLFVSKFSYGYSRYSFPLGIVPFEGRVIADKPERGDVVVFRLPSNVSVDYIKRIVGLPGDRVQVKEGKLYINDTLVPRRSVGTQTVSLGYRDVTIEAFEETMDNGKSYIIHEISDNDRMDNTAVYTVPEGHYFMMGDNRDQSKDSRFLDVGTVPYQNLIGRADFIFFSVDQSARLWEIWKWPFAIRYERIANGIK
ncbi:MAG: signal peptidase I [Candidatus Puniceispirillaceae bacterium]